jgi:hypothetical protein
VLPEAYWVTRHASGPCVYCGKPACTVDHVRPLTRGGEEHEGNLVPACMSCNTSKGNRLLTEWRPDRVCHGAEQSAIVAAEYRRLTGQDAPHTAEWLYRRSPKYAAVIDKIISEWR